MSTPLVALCIGHSRQINGRTEGGAVSVSGVNEHTYNGQLASRIEKILAGYGIDSFTVSRYEGNGYTAAQRWLADHLMEKGAAIAIELHFNSSDNDSATGHEWLHWQSSMNGKRLASSLDRHHLEMFPDFKRRGIKPKGSSDRGGEFLRFTHCPSVIAEPFFGSNPDDWHHAESAKETIALAIALGIKDYLS